jgi:anti-sigma regulatory factor (Ser/Thr protein kinase)
VTDLRVDDLGESVPSPLMNRVYSRTPEGLPSEGEGCTVDPPSAGGRPSVTAFHDTYPAIATSVRAVRTALRQFVEGLGVSAETREAVTLAVSEAATNVVVHAYIGRDLPGTIEVNATVAEDELWVIVTDTGLGLRPRLDSPGLGLGLAIIAQLADGVDLVRPAAGGLELRMRFALSGEFAR